MTSIRELCAKQVFEFLDDVFDLGILYWNDTSLSRHSN